MTLRAMGGGRAHRQGLGRRVGYAARVVDPGRGRDLRLRAVEAGARAVGWRARMDGRNAVSVAPSAPPARLPDHGVAHVARRAATKVLRDHRSREVDACRSATTVG